MSDWIEGPVVRIIDGDTFDMRVKWVSESNRRTYNDVERIRIAGTDTPERGRTGAAAATERLRLRLSGKCVRCTVQARDTYRRLVCTVRVVPCRAAIA